MSVDLGRGTRRFQRFVTLGGAKPSGGEPPRPRGRARSRPPPVGPPARVPQARPAPADQEPGHVRGRDHRRPRDADPRSPTLAGLAGGRRRPGSGSRSRSRSGCGSPSSSRRTPRPWPRRAGEPRRRPCARRAPRRPPIAARADGSLEDVGSSELRKGDVIVVEEGETIAGDGDVIEGIGFVNEAAITGESAPVLKEPGTDIRSSVTGGTTLVSDRHRGPRDDRPRRDVPRPDDRARRRRQAPADAERDRARDPARRSDDRVPDGDRHPAAVRRSTRARPSTPSPSWRCSSASSRRPSAACCRPSASPGMDRVARFNVLAMSGRAVEASGDVDVILLDKTGTITYGNRLAASITRGARRDRGGGRRGRPGRVDPRRDPGGPLDRRPRPQAPGRARTRRPAPATRRASRRSAATIAEEIPFRAETRTSGVRTTDGTTILKGAVDAIDAEGRRRCPTEVVAGDATGSPTSARTPLVARERGPDPRRHRAQGHRQGRARRALRRVPPDGHPDRDDHRRQPADRRDHRQGGGRRRLHRAGHARGQDRLHPRAAGRGPPGRDDRRRHQRRAGARPVGRRPGDEQRHVRGQGRGQHGRPRLRPDQAARGHRDRQAAADHPRLDHDVLDRQRRREVLRDRPGDVRRGLPGARTRSTSWVWRRPRARSSRRSSSTR